MAGRVHEASATVSFSAVGYSEFRYNSSRIHCKKWPQYFSAPLIKRWSLSPGPWNWGWPGDLLWPMTSSEFQTKASRGHAASAFVCLGTLWPLCEGTQAILLDDERHMALSLQPANRPAYEWDHLRSSSHHLSISWRQKHTEVQQGSTEPAPIRRTTSQLPESWVK